jgi:hypothetical protein
MGHFSYTCHLSGLPITGGTKCVLLPLLPRDKVYDASTESLKRFGVGCLVSNDAYHLYFRELCFPIFGTYDEYGGIEKIEKDDNTAVLEEYFGMKIKDIVNCILDGRKDQFKVDQTGKDAEKDEFGLSVSKDKLKLKSNPHRILLVRASATWYRRDVYDQLIAKHKDRKKSKYDDKLDLGVPGLLKFLGFKKGKDKGRGRYNIPFTKKNLTVWSDGNWISDTQGDSHSFGIYYLEDFQKWCEEKHGVKINIEELRQTTMYGQVYKCLIPSIKELEDHDRWTSERIIRMLLGSDDTLRYTKKDLGEKKFRLAELIKEKEEKPEQFKERYERLQFDPIEFYQSMVDEAEKRGEVSQLPLLYFQKIKELGNNFLFENIVNWHIFRHYYYSTGRFLYPIGTGPQDGGHKEALELMEVSYNIIKNEVEERYGDNEDDEDEE